MNWRWWSKKEVPGRQPRLMAGQDDYVFRRSRTLTGSISPQVQAVAETRGQFKTDRLKLHELKAHRSQLLKTLGGVVAVIAALSFLLVNYISVPSLRVLQPGKHPAVQSYQETLYAYFADHPLERFGFLLKHDAVGEYLIRKHPELRAVRIDQAWYGGQVAFSIFFRQPLLVWQSGDKRFYVDDQGIAFRYNHFDEPSVAATDQSGIPPTSSGAIASSRFIQFLGRMVGALNGYGRGKVVSVIIPASTRQIDLKLTGRDYSIKTHIDRDPLQQAEDIANALKFFDERGIKPQYVDVRVAHKAYYR